MKLKNFQGLGMNINSDKYLLPGHYTPIEMPYYKGDGEHSVKELQELCNNFKNTATNKLLSSKF